LLAIVVAAGCGPRNKIGDRLIDQSSLTNARSSVATNQQKPAPPP
jgi:hypothetical protein